MAQADNYLQPRLISIPNAASLLSIGRTKTYGLISEGLLETVSIGARRLITLRSIDRLIEQAAMGEAA
jgi:excisionase family DNA binding protein